MRFLFIFIISIEILEIDISRWDLVHYPDSQFEYNLEEPLPLAPTEQRKIYSYTAYDAKTRLYTLATSNYPVSGVDSFWQSTINSFVNGTTPVISNVLVAHPDAKPDSPGTLVMARYVNFTK